MTQIMKPWSKKKFNEFLSKRVTEDLDFIEVAENFLLKKRGYVFKQPKVGEKVILLLSGGIDSTVAWETLINVYGYQVYPVVIDRGSSRRAKRELSAVRNLEKYFAKKYPDKYIRPFHLKVNTTPELFSKILNSKKIYGGEVLANFNKNRSFVRDLSNVVLVKTRGVTPYLIPFYGAVYSGYLKLTQGLEIKNIFVGANFTDGIEVSSQSFTALRSTLLSICIATGDYSWNFSSVFLERETGILLEKGGTIKLGADLGTPLEKTWSCYRDGIFQCGNSCATCVNRKSSFAEVGIEDKTIYLSDLKTKIKNYFNFKIKFVKNFVKNLVKSKV